MRVAIVTESFLPQVNGVTTTVRHIVDRLLERGDDPLVVAPGPGPDTYRGVRVVRVRSVGLPGYRGFPVGLPDAEVERALATFVPDVVHLASPVALGAVGLSAARRLGMPVVAVYQTDLAGFARQYGLHTGAVATRWMGRIHRRADRTLVPSRAAATQLRARGVRELYPWGRGVASETFSPTRRDAALRRRWSDPRSEHDTVLVGYVGRLAAEKQVRRLVELDGLPGTRVVVVGDGPERPWLERRLPEATFTGMLTGPELATAFASLDLFVHPGTAETFCQTVQEAQASGVPVVAPAAGGPLDLVSHGRTGLLVDPDDGPALRATVAGAVADPLLRERLSRKGLARVAGRSWPRLVDELVETHYAAVLGRDAARGAA